MKRELSCLRCGASMNLLRSEHLPLGKPRMEFGIAHYTPGNGIQTDIYCCPRCGKLEFYLGDRKGAEDFGAEDHIAQVRCLQCGTEYDMDQPKCPACGAKNLYV